MKQVPLQPNEQDGSIELQGRIIYRQMLEAIQNLHDNHQICHRDVDPGVNDTLYLFCLFLLWCVLLSLILFFSSQGMFLFVCLNSY